MSCVVRIFFRIYKWSTLKSDPYCRHHLTNGLMKNSRNPTKKSTESSITDAQNFLVTRWELPWIEIPKRDDTLPISVEHPYLTLINYPYWFLAQPVPYSKLDRKKNRTKGILHYNMHWFSIRISSQIIPQKKYSTVPYIFQNLLFVPL